jgi:hypothetical protein
MAHAGRAREDGGKRCMAKLSTWGARAGRLGFYAVVGAGLWLMFEASASYFDLGEDHPFFLEKLPLAQPRMWLTALYVHVALASCSSQVLM